MLMLDICQLVVLEVQNSHVRNPLQVLEATDFVLGRNQLNQPYSGRKHNLLDEVVRYVQLGQGAQLEKATDVSQAVVVEVQLLDRLQGTRNLSNESDIAEVVIVEA